MKTDTNTPRTQQDAGIENLGWEPEPLPLSTFLLIVATGIVASGALFLGLLTYIAPMVAP